MAAIAGASATGGGGPGGGGRRGSGQSPGRAHQEESKQSLAKGYKREC